MGRGRSAPPTGGEPPGEEPGDEALVRAILAGRAPFDDLFNRYWEPIHRFASYRLGSWEDADDVAQLVMTKLARDLPAFRFGGNPGALRTWLFGVAFNQVVDERRRARRGREVPFREATPVSSRVPSPEEEALAASTHGWLRALFGRLPIEQRDVMELRAAGFTNAEIAVQLGKTPDNVRQLHGRACKTLHDLMTQAAGGEGHA